MPAEWQWADINMNIDDDFLIERLRQGDQMAYKVLFNRHYEPLCRFACQLLHDRETAQTVVDDVVFNLWQQRDSLAVSTTLRSYLFGAVRNRCVNELKALHRRLSLRVDMETDEAEEAMLSHVFVDADHPLGLLIRQELEAEINRCINLLPKECRQVFVKSRVEQKQYKEIAAEMGISVNTVKYHMKNAMKLLQGALQGYMKWIVFLILLQ